jgi:hypothetical protein
MRPTPMTTPTLIVTLAIYALGIGAGILVDNARGTGNDIAFAVAFGLTLHAAFHFGHLYRESRKPR